MDATGDRTTAVFVQAGNPVLVREVGAAWSRGPEYLECQGLHNLLYAGNALGDGDFRITVRLAILDLARSAASFVIDDHSHFGFEGAAGEIFTSGRLFGSKTSVVGRPADFITAGRPFEFQVIREGNSLRLCIDGKTVHEVKTSTGRFGTIALRPWRSRMRVYDFSATGRLLPLPPGRTQPVTYTIPTVDLSAERWRQHIVESTPGQYLGHPTTVLLDDGRTILCTYPLGHGGPAAVLKKSTDGGRTWSERLSVPDNWATATNCPCLHKLTGPDGVQRLLLMEGYGAMRQAVSLDEGETWTPLEPNGLQCIVAPITVLPISGGRHLCAYHRGPNDKDRSPLTLWQAVSDDGGLTWHDQRLVGELEGTDPCEPALIRSPDDGQIATIARENTRRLNSLLMTSDDEGQTWSELRELPASLTGDRHMPRYSPDGRLVMCFRDVAQGSPTQGDFVAWIGTYEDLVSGGEGQYRVRLLNSPVKGDLGYPGLELLPDGTLVATTYAVLNEGEKQSVVSVHFSLGEIDRKAALLPAETVVYRAGEDDTHTYRIPALAVSRQGTLLAFAEARRRSAADDGDIELVLKRSFDGGQTWGAMQVLADDEGNTMGNPCPIVDPETGRIVLLFCRNNRRVFVMHSDDDGARFSTPLEITDSLRNDFAWSRVATGPGNGIRMASGRMVVPMWTMAGELGAAKEYRAGVMVSDDRGQTWRAGRTVAPLYKDCNECEVVQAADGRLCLNMRSSGDAYRRVVAWSEDGGESWGEPRLDDALVDPVCDASLIQLRTAPPAWAFSNPDSKRRMNLTLRLSFDEGATWPVAKVLHAGPSAYSCLAELPDGSIGCLYERGVFSPYESIAFARCSMQWLQDGMQEK